jgi:hypothetical protein
MCRCCKRCPDSQIDVDGIYNGDPYGDNETMVVFWTITGVASPVNEDPPPGKWYFFSPDDTDCGGEAPWERARVLIRFVDMLDPDFVPANSDTWVWKGIETVSIRTLHDLCVAPDIPAESASISVQAYGNINQSEMITLTKENGKDMIFLTRAELWSWMFPVIFAITFWMI